MNSRPRLRTITAVLFIFPIVELIAEDLMDLFGLFGQGVDVHSAVSALPPHPMFHVLTAPVGFFGATAILSFSVAFGPYLRGERWAWVALLLADLAVILANVWGTLTIYVHSISNGIIPELWFPSAVLALAVVLSWLDFFSPKRAATRT